MMPRFLRWFFDNLTRLLTDRHVEGMENLPAEGPYIVTVNHLGVADTALVYGLMGGEHLTGWAAEKWQNHPIFGLLLRMGGGIFIQRGEVDRHALSGAVRWLKSGRVFGMAPEGTRSRTGTMMRAKTGVAYLAHQTGAPIIPVALTGTENAVKALLRFRRQRVTVTVGEPFQLPPLDENNRAGSLRRNSDEVMCRLAAMLPPRYRGVYADHPRLQQLLASSSD